MANQEHKGFRRIYNAFFYSLDGFKAAWENEAAFRQELFLALVLIPAAFWVGEGAQQISLLIFTVLIVLITELLNTGVEAAIDRISGEKHELSKRAKDIGSAAVFVSLTALAIVWGFAVYEKFF